MLCCAIQIECRTDQGQMTECLWRIAQLLPTPRNFLRKHTQVIRKVQHILKDVDGTHQVLIVIHSCAGQSFYKPKGAHAKCTFPATDA